MKQLASKLFSINLSTVILLASLPLSSPANSEEIRYIRDTLFVPLRSGQSFKHRIVHKGLVSGTHLTLLEQNEDQTYSLVKTQNGIEGWLQTQYLSDQPSARSMVNSLTLKNEQLTRDKIALSKELSSIKKQHKDASQTISKLTSNNQKNDKELAEIKNISANAITLNNDNKVLLQSNQELQNKVDLLQTDNQHLNDSVDNKEFLNGAFAVLIGVFITLLVPRLWPQKSTEWS